VVFLALLGDAYFRKGNVDQAEENYLLALAAQKENADAILGLAKVSQNRGDTQGALVSGSSEGTGRQLSRTSL